MKKLVFLTAYDYLTAQILEETNIDGILVGDSLGMTFEGKKNTQEVTLEQMIYHTKAVRRGAPKTQIITDLPIGTYRTPEESFKNAKKILEAGADMLKLEGSKEILPQIDFLRKNKIKIVGHIGLTPQTTEKFKVIGRDPTGADKLLEDAQLLDKLGIEFLVLECIPATLAKKITKKIKTPTIGIGAGVYCDGQILVFQDLVGLTPPDFQPKFLKRYLNARKIFSEAIEKFKREVKGGKFPSKQESY